MEISRYTLYIGLPQDLRGVEYQYFSPKSGYQLAYSDKPVYGMEVVPLENESFLTDDEKVWLRSTKIKINAKAVREHEKQYAEALNGFLDVLEKELDAQVKMAQGSKENSDDDE